MHPVKDYNVTINLDGDIRLGSANFPRFFLTHFLCVISKRRMHCKAKSIRALQKEHTQKEEEALEKEHAQKREGVLQTLHTQKGEGALQKEHAQKGALKKEHEHKGQGALQMGHTKREKAALSRLVNNITMGLTEKQKR